MYSQTTQSINVTVTPIFLEEKSVPEKHDFVWAYHILIHNQGRYTVQVLSRYWHITDAFGQVQEIRGEGVVGEQPILEPGGVFEYTSGVALTAPSGIMRGAYHLKQGDGIDLEVLIPAFSLDSPHQKRHVN